MKIKTISLFLNGQACYWDEKGEQIPHLHKQGWCGLHEARKNLAEDASVLIVDFEAEKAIELKRHHLDELLKVLRRRKKR